MANFPSPSQIQSQYLSILKGVKPTININDPNSDFVIRGKAVTGIASGLYGDQQKINNDTFISSARPEALTKKGADYQIAQQPETEAVGDQVRLTGTNGTVVNPGDLTLIYVPTNVLYTNTTGGTVAGGILDIAVQAQVTGQIGNVKTPDTLNVVSPPTGINVLATLIQDIADGTNVESVDSYRARLLSRLQDPPAGGNKTDYPAFAFAADPSVRSAFIFRFGRGLGTVDVYITTGTTDIDDAVTNGIAVVRIPSGSLITTVQDYYDAHVPLTDCAEVFAPIELLIAVTVNVVYAAGLTGASVPADPLLNPLGLTCAQLVQREISRVLYKYTVGGRKVPGHTLGVVVAADLEAGLDTWLSAVSGSLGKIPVLADREVQKLDGANWDLEIAANELAAPGVITVVEGV